MLSFAHVHAPDYARQVQEHPRAEIAVVWDEDPDRGRQWASRLGVPFEPDLDRVLAREDVQGVVVDAPSSMHPDIMVRAAKAGKHIFTEKVLAITVAECDRILAAVREAGVRLVVSMPQLSRPDVRFVEQALAEGLLGDVTMIRARIGHDAALSGWWAPGNWFRDPERAGGGALIDLGCHPVYIVRHLMGPARSVWGRLSNFSGAYEVDDNAVVVLEFENKALGVVEASWVQRGGPQLLEVYGTRGSVVVDRGQGTVVATGEAFTGSRRGSFVPASLPPPGRMPMVQWIEAVLDGVEPDIRPEQGRELTEILEAAARSHREGRPVSLPLD